MNKKLLIRNAKQIITVCSNREPILRGPQMNQVAIYPTENTVAEETKSECQTFSLVANTDGKIEDIDTSDQICRKYATSEFEREIDATGKCIIPGKYTCIIL